MATHLLLLLALSSRGVGLASSCGHTVTKPEAEGWGRKSRDNSHTLTVIRASSPGLLTPPCVGQDGRHESTPSGNSIPVLNCSVPYFSQYLRTQKRVL